MAIRLPRFLGGKGRVVEGGSSSILDGKSTASLRARSARQRETGTVRGAEEVIFYETDPGSRTRRRLDHRVEIVNGDLNSLTIIPEAEMIKITAKGQPDITIMNPTNDRVTGNRINRQLQRWYDAHGGFIYEWSAE